MALSFSSDGCPLFSPQENCSLHRCLWGLWSPRWIIISPWLPQQIERCFLMPPPRSFAKYYSAPVQPASRHIEVSRHPFPWADQGNPAARRSHFALDMLYFFVADDPFFV